MCDASGMTVLKIVGPFCTCSCFGDVEFKVCTQGGRREAGRESCGMDK